AGGEAAGGGPAEETEGGSGVARVGCGPAGGGGAGEDRHAAGEEVAAGPAREKDRRTARRGDQGEPGAAGRGGKERSPAPRPGVGRLSRSLFLFPPDSLRSPRGRRVSRLRQRVESLAGVEVKHAVDGDRRGGDTPPHLDLPRRRGGPAVTEDDEVAVPGPD